MSECLCAHLAKAKRLTDALFAPLVFFFMTVTCGGRVTVVPTAPCHVIAGECDQADRLFSERFTPLSNATVTAIHRIETDLKS
ncbi:hypothetical protein [Thiorhodococcus minor]|uniref:Uncharacterized protein n=1 Tax=Thiorhodococcus minor TaxID=57489 RepID=A0A6M0K7C5_9GAMM|nr:hypothetical protein [Thiorhodococcus minor]NEV64265.1 hypothetical protein [Thiorhodococcus minor]